MKTIANFTWITSKKLVLTSGRRATLRRFAPCPSGHKTADKKLHIVSPKLPSATSFIRKTLGEISATK